MKKIVIEIPKEFESEFSLDRFKGTFKRALADEHCLVGNYEIETMEMLIIAFKNAEILKEEK